MECPPPAPRYGTPNGAPEALVRSAPRTTRRDHRIAVTWPYAFARRGIYEDGFFERSSTGLRFR